MGGERQGKAMGKVGRSLRPVIHYVKCAAYIALRRYDKGNYNLQKPGRRIGSLN